MDDGEWDSYDDSNDQVPGDSAEWQCRPRGYRVVTYRAQRGMGSVVPAIMSLHVKCPIFSVTDDKNGKSCLLQSNNLMNSQAIVGNAKCGRFCLTLGGDAHF